MESRGRAREEDTTEYRLYARVSDAATTLTNTMTELTEEDLINKSDCVYQNLWMPAVKEHLKAGLLLGQKGFKMTCGTGISDTVHDTTRVMYFIPGDVGLCFYQFNRSLQWYQYGEVLQPARYWYFPWNRDVIFTTPNGKAIQMKVVDARASPEVFSFGPMKQRPRMTSDGGVGMPTPSLHLLADMRMHLSDTFI
jgi:hypothetical protein